MLLAVSACTPQAAAPTVTVEDVRAGAVPGAADPESAVVGLVAALVDGDYERAAALTVDDQMVAIAVAEDSSVGALGAVLEDGGNDVAANYWRGFAKNLEDLLAVSPSDITVGGVTEIDVEGVAFARVGLDVPVDTVRRRLIVRQGDGWKVDVVASFAPTLAGRLGRAADSLRADPTASHVLEALAQQRLSLEGALAAGGFDAETAQMIRSAVVSLGG